MKVLTVVRIAAGIRVAIGTALALRTRPLLKAMLRDEEPSSSHLLFARTVGIRDALFGLGCLLSSFDAGRTHETRRWIQLWLANEAADIAAAIAMSRQLSPGGAAIAAGAPLPLIAVDVWTLRHLTGEGGAVASFGIRAMHTRSKLSTITRSV